MPKQKFNSVDVAAEVAELRRLVVGSWLANIYDLDDKKTFLLKFTKSGGRTESGEGEKTIVLLESGARFHSTSYVRERKADAPGKLNAKLRMHLRGKKLNAVAQLGSDRAVEFVFGANDTKHSLVLELYAQGNLVLLDKNDTILTLLRPVRDDDAGLVMLGNHTYDRGRFRGRTCGGPVDAARVEAALATGEAPPVTTPEETSRRSSSVARIDSSTTGGGGGRSDANEDEGETKKAPDAAVSASRPPRDAPPPRTLREALCRAFGLSPQIADRVASRAGAPKGGLTTLPLFSSEEERDDDEADGVASSSSRRLALLENLAQELHRLEEWLDKAADGLIAPEGHAEEFLLEEEIASDTSRSEESSSERVITAKEVTSEKGPVWVSESFSPFPFPEEGDENDDGVGEKKDSESSNKKQKRFRVEPRGFDALVDAHFASIEHFADVRARERASKNADKKADKVRRDQERRAADLRREEEREETRATLIEYNLEKVDAVLAAVNALLASGQSWDEIERFVDDERRAGNPVAALVRKLDLANDAVTVGLTNRLDNASPDASPEETEETFRETDDASNEFGSTRATHVAVSDQKKRSKSVAVTLSLSLSAYANAREHFERKKKHAAKFEKTVARSGDAVASANRDFEARKRQAARRKKVGVGAVSLRRTPEWFEKFHWFITPENCLVVSARDSSQTDLLVKKYMGPNDAFVRADVPKAPATVVKAPLSLLEKKRAAKDGSCDDANACLVPPLSLAHAGAACLCRSAAWDTRTVISAWWVPARDVRKTAPNGDPLAQGAVWHVGEKRYLPPAPLVMGYAYAFLVASEADVQRHAEDRAVRVFEPHEEPDDEKDRDDDENRRGENDGGVARKSALDAFLDGSVETAPPNPPLRTSETDRPEDDGDDDGEGEQLPRASKEGVETKPRAPPPSGRAGKGRISAAERRAMKKRSRGGGGGDGDSKEPPGDPPKKPSGEKPKKPQAAPGASSVDASGVDGRAKTKPLPRGKSAKARRAAAKYAEQDEEDRALAMALLGVRIADEKQPTETRAEDVSASADADTDSSAAADVAVTNAVTSEDDGATPAVSTARAKGGEYAADDEEEEEAVVDVVDDDDDDDDEAEASAVSFAERDLARVARVDWFTGAPFLETETTHAVALVAPWDALKSFAYKAKLTPGSQKKGKAAKTALDVVMRAPPATDVMRSREMMPKETTHPDDASSVVAADEENVLSSVVARQRTNDVRVVKSVDSDGHETVLRDVGGERRNPETVCSRIKPSETRREKAARADRDAALKAKIAAAADAAAAGDGATLMCGQGVKVSMPAGAAKAMNASKPKKGGKRG